MSTMLLYRVLGIREYTYKRMTYENGVAVVEVEQPRDKCACSACGSKDLIFRGKSAQRYLRLPPLVGKQALIALAVPRAQCRSCNRTRQVKVTFAKPMVSYTNSFARYVLDLSKSMTIQDIAGHLQVGWDLIKEIQKAALQRRFQKPKLKHLRQIAIDEIAVGKNHKYLTVVMDLSTGAVVFVGDGKKADALAPFWKRLRSSHAKIEAVAIEMSAAYISAVENHLPAAAIVFDHFQSCRSCRSLPPGFASTRWASWRTTTTRSQRVPWKGRTTKSRPSSVSPTDFVITSSSNSRSCPSMRQRTNSSASRARNSRMNPIFLGANRFPGIE